MAVSKEQQTEYMRIYREKGPLYYRQTKIPGETKQEQLQRHQKNYRKNNPIKYLYSQSKRRATARGQEFNIQISDIIIPDTCPLLGRPLNSWSDNKFDKPSIKYYLVLIHQNNKAPLLLCLHHSRGLLNFGF